MHAGCPGTAAFRAGLGVGHYVLHCEVTHHHSTSHSTPARLGQQVNPPRADQPLARASTEAQTPEGSLAPPGKNGVRTTPKRGFLLPWFFPSSTFHLKSECSQQHFPEGNLKSSHPLRCSWEERSAKARGWARKCVTLKAALRHLSPPADRRRQETGFSLHRYDTSKTQLWGHEDPNCNQKG